MREREYIQRKGKDLDADVLKQIAIIKNMPASERQQELTKIGRKQDSVLESEGLPPLAQKEEKWDTLTEGDKIAYNRILESNEQELDAWLNSIKDEQDALMRYRMRYRRGITNISDEKLRELDDDARSEYANIKKMSSRDRQYELYSEYGYEWDYPLPDTDLDL